MQSNRLWVRGCALAVTFLLAAGALFAAPALKVLSATPKGQLTYTGRQAVNITFNQPVVALGEESEFSSSDCPISITPAVKGSCRYSGTQTLVFEPTSDWPDATAFTVKLKAGFKSAVSGQKLAQAYTFDFTTPRPQVNMVRPGNNERWINLYPTLYVVFNMPVDLETINDYAELSYMVSPEPTLSEKIGLSKTKRPDVKKTVPLIIRPISQLEWEKDFSYYQQERIIAVNALDTLQKGTRYTLTFKEGLKGTRGSLGMAKAYETSFYTYPELSVLGAVKKGCLPFVPSVDFSSPVRMRELYAAAKVEPASAKRQMTEQELNALGTDVIDAKTGAAYFRTMLSFLDLQPGQNITVTINKNLQDIYGNQLGQDYTFTVSNNGYCPAADFSGGLGVLESYLSPRLPIDLMNTPSLPVRGARFNKENFIPFDKAANSYCAQKPLTDPTFSGNYTFKDVKDRTYKTFIDLTKFNPTAKDSIVFSQVKLTGKKYGDKGCWVSSTDNITDVGVTFKTSPEDILLWATSLQTGEPLANLAVELRDKTNKILWTGSTDMNGLARAPGWKKLDTQIPSWGQPEIYAFVSSAGGDAVVSSLWNQGLEPWRFNLSYDYNPQQEYIRSVLFADRGVYRPGETMYIKGIVRLMADGSWRLPDVVRGTVTIGDSRGEEVFKQDVTVSSGMGTFDLKFDIPKNAFTGRWGVRFIPAVKDAKDVPSAFYPFEVEAVKQADFKVNLRVEGEDYLPGQEAAFAASAQYNFGAPLAQAKAQWTLRREMDWFEPKGFNGYTFTPYFLRENEYKENGKLLLNSSGELDAKGALSFSARMPSVSFPTRVYAELGVQSPARQELFARTSVLVHPAAFYLGAKLLSERVEVGEPVRAEIVALTPQGKRTEAEVTAQIHKEQWFSIRKTGLSGRLEWVSEKKVTQLPSQTLKVGEKGAELRFTPQESGSYYVTLTSQDEQGRQVIGGFDIFVYGEGQAYWKKTDDDLLVLTADKNEYKPGKTARISVQSPYEKALALVTVEREGILDAWVTTVKGGADYVEVPVKPSYLPNVYVSVTLVRGRTADPVDEKGLDLGKPQGKVGYVNLNVVPDSKKIEPVIKPNKTKYQPGDEVTLKITAKPNAKNTPAEVVVMVVDEGVLALSDFKTPDLFSEFYGSRPVSVFTMDNRVYVVGQRNFGEKGENRGGGGSSDAKLGGVDLRSNFVFTPYFNALVTTDKKGRAEVKFKLPDNLTKFRIMAVAMTADEFGSAETFIQVSKPVMVTSNLPRFARKGDTFSCGAVVYNYEDKKGDMEVSARAEGAVKLSGPETQTVNVPLGAAREVTWACEAIQDGAAQVAFSVKGKKDSDGVQTKLTVSPVEKQQTLALYAATDGTQEELLDKPGNLNASADNRITLSLASTALLNLKGSMVYLMTYPYDCLEQKMSKILPVVTGAQLVEDFKLGDMDALKAQVQEVLDGMTDYQSAAGGFGYWKNSQPDPYVTAYALEVAQLAKQAGYTVPEQALQKAAQWLEGAFSSKVQKAYSYSSLETDTARAYAVYVLALYGQNVQSAFNNLYGKIGSLPLPAKAYLLKAAQAGENTAQVKEKIAQGILNHIAYTPQAAYFDTPAQMPWLHMDNVKGTALALDALLYAQQPFADGFKTASWLISQLNAEGHWNNTSVNAAVFTALNTYYRAIESTEPDYAASAKLGVKELLSASFKGRTVDNPSASVPFADVYGDGAEARMTFAKKGAGMLYYTLGQVYEPLRYDKPVDAGFTVSREITTLDGQPVTEIVAGERYKITLRVKNAASRYFVVVEDFIPAGFEIINTSLATESQEQAAALNTGAYNGFERDEKYDDRIAAFADYLPAGEHTYSYLVSASVAGTFAYPSLWASQMYEPAVFGRNATETLVIK